MLTQQRPRGLGPAPPAPVPADHGAKRHASLVLLVACLAQFMVVLDVAVVNVAIPQMTHSLGLTSSGQQWVIDAYTLTFGGLLLLGGRLSDLFGQRRLFLIGTSLFTIFSLVCGLAQNELMIELARGAQGIGAAIMAPTSLSLLTTAFTDPEERHKAIGVWAAVAASGAAAGVLVGGVLTSLISWRWVFFINIPVGVLILFITQARIHLPRTQSRRRLDIPGAILITGSIGLILYAIIGVASRGWGSATTLGLLAGGIAALVAFIAVEARLAPDPLLPLGLFRDRQRASANGVFAIIGAVIFFLYFEVSLHLQRVDGDSPIKAGLSFLPVALATTTAALNGRRLIKLLGARRQLFIGLLLAAAGFVWISTIGVHAEYWTHVGLPMIVLGLGMGLAFVPATAAATSDVPPEQAGIASGVVNTSRQVGGAIGLAALSTIAASGLGAHPAAHQIAGGDQTALIVAAGLAVAGALLALMISPLGRQPHRADS